MSGEPRQCDALAAAIQQCQSNGIKVILSLSGVVGTYSLSSQQEAQIIGQNLWEAYGNTDGSDIPGPFGSTFVDGWDFDLEVIVATNTISIWSANYALISHLTTVVLTTSLLHRSILSQNLICKRSSPRPNSTTCGFNSIIILAALSTVQSITINGCPILRTLPLSMPRSLLAYRWFDHTNSSAPKPSYQTHLFRLSTSGIIIRLFIGFPPRRR
jgi:hypothetical protein